MRPAVAPPVPKSTIRSRAAAFAARYADARSEAADRQTFWNDFFAVFDVDRTQVAAFELLAKRSSTGNRGWIDLIYPGQMAVEHKSAGEDLAAAMSQLVDYLPSLTRAEHPWLLVACDFQRFQWQNLRDGNRGEFALVDLPDNVDLFWWIAGHRGPTQDFENVANANLKATQLLADIHDQLAANGYDEHALREWLTRVLFCLFADDSGVWDRAAFHAYVAAYTRPDGSDLGPAIAYLFQILNTPPPARPRNLDESLAQFTYINGDLFSDTIAIPSCDTETRDALLAACVFDWAAISPAIFGSMFQSVMNREERRHLGAHYTTEENILRTIGPLFLDELASDLARATTKPTLEKFLDKLSMLTFFDPACGCGNFLVIAYREIRVLETEAVRRLRQKQGRNEQMAMDIALLFKVRVDQFYGIEIEEFPARIARTALYLMDHQCNRAVSTEFGEHYARFPIPAAPHIIIANALELDWNKVLPASRAEFVFGNPPFIGRGLVGASHREELEAIWGSRLNSSIDYVSGWFACALLYLSDRPTARWAFVATSSMCQGEAVPLVWSAILGDGWRTRFAHRSLQWTSDASGKAIVHVSIIGFDKAATPKPVLWAYPAGGKGKPIERTATNINPYLVDGPNVIVFPRERPLASDLPPVNFGNMARDGGFLLVEPRDYEVIKSDVVAARYLRPFLGARELMHGGPRWCLWMVNLVPGEIAKSPILRQRLAGVRAFRESSQAVSTREMASTPHLFGQRSQPNSNYLAIPRHVSEHRRYFPVRYCGPETICGDANFLASDPDGLLFGILSSSMFATWMKTVGGRIKSDPRFSKTLVYNNFPMPDLTEKWRDGIRTAAARVVAVRAGYPGSSLSDLYDPLGMPADLIAAHNSLDGVVDSIFGARKRIDSVASRQTILFDQYGELATSREIPRLVQ